MYLLNIIISYGCCDRRLVVVLISPHCTGPQLTHVLTLSLRWYFVFVKLSLVEYFQLQTLVSEELQRRLFAGICPSENSKPCHLA